MFSGVSKIYGHGPGAERALDDVDITIARGEFVAVYGRSGSGKSTLPNLAGALDLPSAGAVTLFGGPPTHWMSRADAAWLRNRHVGFIFQQYNLFARFTVAENVETPLVYAGMGAALRARKVTEALALVGLNDLRARRVTAIGPERAYDTRTIGVTADYFALGAPRAGAGRLLSREDETGRERYVVLGSETADRLFGPGGTAV